MRRAFVVGVGLALSAGIGVAVVAQNRVLPPGRATSLTVAEVKTAIAAYPGSPTSLKSLDAGKHVVDIWVDHRKAGMKATQGERGEGHSDLTEIYYIVSGRGTLATGGQMVNPQFMTPSGRGLAGGAQFLTPTYIGKYEGGVTQSLGAGDIVVIPPGTVHQWISVDSPDDLTFLNTRIDPEHKQPAAFLNPALKK